MGEPREEEEGGSWGTFCRDSFPKAPGGGQPAELLCRLTPPPPDGENG